MSLRILYEDNHLLAVAKPAGIPTQGALAGRPSLINQAKQYIREKYRKPGNVFLGVLSRLDSPVSGVVVFARTSKAAARLAKQFRDRTAAKTYWAIVEGKVEPPTGDLTHWMTKDEAGRRMVAVRRPQTGAQQARLSYRCLKASAGQSLLEITLHTGRKHQLRVQLAACGHPILGDRKYGARQTFEVGIALHCRRLVVEHPVKHTPVELVAPPPRAWKRVSF